MRKALFAAFVGWLAGAISMILWRAHLDGSVVAPPLSDNERLGSVQSDGADDGS